MTLTRPEKTIHKLTCMSGQKGSTESRRNFSKKLILDVVRQVEAGVSRHELYKQYGMASTTLGEWLKKYGSAHYQANKKVEISSITRRSIMQAVVQGRLTIQEASQTYHITEKTVKAWLRIFRRENNQQVPACIEMKKKKPETSESEEIKALKKALEESQLKVIALETLVDVAERELKIDIRKKSGAKQLPK